MAGARCWPPRSVCSAGVQAARTPASTARRFERVFADYLAAAPCCLARSRDPRRRYARSRRRPRAVRRHSEPWSRLVERPIIHDPNYEPLQENRRRLEAAHDQDGQPFRVVPLPDARARPFRGRTASASYANFYIANRLVLVPTFNDPADRESAQHVGAGRFSRPRGRRHSRRRSGPRAGDPALSLAATAGRNRPRETLPPWTKPTDLAYDGTKIGLFAGRLKHAGRRSRPPPATRLLFLRVVSPWPTDVPRTGREQRHSSNRGASPKAPRAALRQLDPLRLPIVKPEGSNVFRRCSPTPASARDEVARMSSSRGSAGSMARLSASWDQGRLSSCPDRGRRPTDPPGADGLLRRLQAQGVRFDQ